MSLVDCHSREAGHLERQSDSNDKPVLLLRTKRYRITDVKDTIHAIEDVLCHGSVGQWSARDVAFRSMG